MPKQVEKKITYGRWMVIILGLTILLRLPSLFEPYWYGDEAIYLTIGHAMRSGVQLYSQIHDNKPPMLYLMAYIADGDQFWFKILATIWTLATVYVFFLLSKKLFNKRVWVLLVTGLFAFLTSWTKLEGNIANAELFFLLPTVTTVYLLWDKKVSQKRIMLAGVILGMGVLFKMPAVLEAGIWPLLWLVTGDKEWFKKTLILGAGVALPLGISVGYFWMQDALREYMTAAWLQNIPYLSSWKTTSTQAGIYSLKGRLVVTCLVLAPILGFAKTIGKRGLLAGLWGVITLFATLLSGRPYPHYLLQASAAMTLIVITIISGKKAEKITGLAMACLFTGAVVVFHFYNYPTISYYLNFIKWATAQENKQEYYSWFNPQINNDYQAAKIIQAGTNPKDKIFVWGDVPMLYALTKRSPTGKYTVKYHIKDFHAESETMKRLLNEPPKYIVSYGDESELPGLKGLLDDTYRLQESIGQTKIYKLSILDPQRH
jgi:4-amino-4-deoxy-L-arabinose transferase-like glycosyltransferase